LLRKVHEKGQTTAETDTEKGEGIRSRIEGVGSQKEKGLQIGKKKSGCDSPPRMKNRKMSQFSTREEQ